MAAHKSKHAIGRWLLGGAALAFLLVPGHRNMPLAGVPIADVWFFVALLLLGLTFIAMPWRRAPQRRLWPQAVALLALCVIKAAVGLLGAGHGLTATYRTAVQPTNSARRQHFDHIDKDGFAVVACHRIDRELNFHQNSFHPLQQSLNLAFFNAKPLFYIDREQASAARLEAEWIGWIHIPRDGEYRFQADVENDDGWRVEIDDVAFTWKDDASQAHTLRAGAHPIRVRFLRPPTKPLPKEHLKDERPIRFQLQWQRDGSSIETVPWHVLSTNKTGGAGPAGAVLAVTVLLAAGGVLLWGLVPHIAWGRLNSPRQRVRGFLFAMVCLQLGISTFMTIRHTTARPHWNIMARYDYRIYERRAQTFLNHGWNSEAARAEGPVHFSPIMEFYLPALHGLFGDDYGLMAMFQNMLVSLIVLIGFALARRLFLSTAAGCAAAAAMAIDPTFSEPGRLLLPTAPALLLFALAILLLLQLRRRRAAWRACVAGGVFALAMMARVNVIGAVPGAAIALLWPSRVRLRLRMRNAALFVLFAALFWLPLPLRQLQLTGTPYLLNTQGPTTILIGNIPLAAEDEEQIRLQGEMRELYRCWLREQTLDDRSRKLLETFGEKAFKPRPASAWFGEWKPLQPPELAEINPHLRRFFRHYATSRPDLLWTRVWDKFVRFWWGGGPHGGSRSQKGEHFRVHTILFLLALGIACLPGPGRRLWPAVIMVLGVTAVLWLAYYEERHRALIVPLIDAAAIGGIAWGIIRLRRAGRARRRGSIDPLPTPKPSDR